MNGSYYILPLLVTLPPTTHNFQIVIMLNIQNLQVSYDTHLVLNDLSIDFHPNEIHGILGMNGAGKTTFFNAIYNFIKKDKGNCLYNGQPVHQKDIGYLETHNFFYSYLKGKEYLELCAHQNPNFNIEQWNQLFELPLDRLIDNYSTGMKKKLALLGTLALNRPIMILDEPFNGVDLESNEKIYALLLRLREQGKIIILSSHIIESLTNICNKISYLKDGKIEKTYQQAEFGTLELELKNLVQGKIKTTLDKLF